MTPASPRPFHGWAVLAVATLAMTLTVAGNGVGLAVFLDPIIADLGVSRSLVSSFFTVGTLVAAAVLPLLGRALDRFGARAVLTLVSLAFGLALAALAGASGAVSLAAAMVLLRVVGLGAVNLTAAHAVNQWFVRRRGTVLALAGVVVALAMGLYPTLLDAAVSRIGWRMTVLAFAAVLIGGFAPLVAVVMRATPERMGQRPDGSAAGGDGDDPAAEASIAPRQARRSPMLWTLIATDVCVALFIGGLTFHHYDLVALQGVGRGAAVRVFLPMGVATAVATAAAGPMLRRATPRSLALGALLATALAAALSFDVRAVSLTGYGLAIGAALGFKNVLQHGAYAHYFGRRWLGAISGLASGCAFVGTALGPSAFALVRDVAGGYAPVQLAAVIASAALIYPVLRVPAPASAPPASATA